MLQSVRRLLPFFAADRLGGQSVMAFAMKLWGAVASFALSWLIARHFGAAGSGEFGIAVTTVMITHYVVLLGFDTILVRSVAGDLHEGKLAEARGAVVAIGRAVAIGGPIVAVALFAGRDLFARDILSQPDMGPLVGLMIWAVVPLTLQRLASSALRASRKVMLSQFIDGPFGTTLSVLTLGVAIMTGVASSTFVPGSTYVAGVLANCLAGWIAVRALMRRWPDAVLPAVTPLAVAGLPILASNLTNVFTEWYTTVSLGAHWPTAIVGQYRAAWQFVALAGLVQIAMDSILAPRIAAAARANRPDDIARITRRAVALVLALAAPLFVVIFAAPEFLLGLFGHQFVAGARALQILGIGQLIRLGFGPVGVIIVMTGHQRWLMAYALVATLFCVVLCLVLVPRYGIEGAAMATVLTIATRYIGATLVVHFVLHINLLPRFLRRRA